MRDSYRLQAAALAEPDAVAVVHNGRFGTNYSPGHTLNRVGEWVATDMSTDPDNTTIGPVDSGSAEIVPVGLDNAMPGLAGLDNAVPGPGALDMAQTGQTRKFAGGAASSSIRADTGSFGVDCKKKQVDGCFKN